MSELLKLTPEHKSKLIELITIEHNNDLECIVNALKKGNNAVALAYIESAMDWREAIERLIRYY